VLNPGDRLGPYELTAVLGEGGMGRVYSARDTKLGRSVAIKVLPDNVAADPDRIARFDREARTLAALNHPHIAQIYGTEQSGGTHALVMELVDGEDLSQRLSRGPIGWRDAVPIAAQMAEALEAAHEQGIVHRDLKPANVKISADGIVKVLDFGLAKAVESAEASAAAATITSPAAMTQAGFIIGTAAYMSPEQAKGRPADKRSDVWAFGCVLFEMLTGRRAFPGDDVMDTLAAVVRGEPDLSAIPADVPQPIRHLIERCLVKERRARVSDLAVARYVLGAAPGGTASHAETRPWVAWVVTAAAVVIAVAAVAWPRERAPEATGVIRSSIDAPLAMTQGFMSLAISPGATHVAYATTVGRLYIRKLSESTAQPLRGGEGGANPFFSRDGEWLGFFAEGKLKKVPIAGGASRVLADAPSGRGGAWGPDGTIVFVPGPESGLSRVSENGGEVTVLTTPKASERSHRWPHILPDGRHALFTIQVAGRMYDDAAIAVVPIAGGEVRTVIEGGSAPQYLASGHLLYGKGGTVFATAFDPVAVRAGGAAISVIDDARTNSLNGAVPVAVSSQGTLIYLPGVNAGAQMTISAASRAGRLQTVLEKRLVDSPPRFSPDGRRVAVALNDGQLDIWLLDVESRGLNRLTFQSGSKNFPVWSPDGSRIYYATNASGKPHLAVKPVDGSAAETTVYRDTLFPSTISPDGTTLAGRAILGVSASYDVVGLELANAKSPRTLVSSPANETAAAFSPDGRFIAYQSDETGRPEVFVQAHPSGNRWQVTTSGGMDPRWTKAGRELVFRNGTTLMAVQVAQPFSAGPPQTLFSAPSLTQFDVTADGQRFIVVQDGQDQENVDFRLVTGWFEELRARMRQ
jgi:hypothetical protein